MPTCGATGTTSRKPLKQRRSIQFSTERAKHERELSMRERERELSMRERGLSMRERAKHKREPSMRES